MARATIGPRQHVAHFALEHGERREAGDGVEVALNGARADALPGHVQRHAPVHPDHVASGRREVLEKATCLGAEVDQRHAARRRQVQRVAAVRLDVLAVVGRSEAAHPAVEQLQRARAGSGLSRQIAAHKIGELAEQAVPRGGLFVHEALGEREGARGAALDGVTREREGRARETDEGNPRRELAHCEPHRLQHVGERRFGFELGQLIHRGDVADEDRGVDTEPVHGLERDLGGEGGLVTQLEKGVRGAERAVLRHVAPGLAHEPHGRGVGRLAAARLQEAAVVRQSVGQPRARAPQPEQ